MTHFDTSKFNKQKTKLYHTKKMEVTICNLHFYEKQKIFYST